MSTGVRLAPAERSRIAADTNLAVLRRQDPAVESVERSSSHVAVYELPLGDGDDAPQWRRMDVEGSLFIVRRREEPRYRIVVINRKSPVNYTDELTPGKMELETAEQMIMYKNAQDRVRGIWFWESKDMDEIVSYIRNIVERSEKMGPDAKRLPQPAKITSGTKAIPKKGRSAMKKSKVPTPPNKPSSVASVPAAIPAAVPASVPAAVPASVPVPVSTAAPIVPVQPAPQPYHPQQYSPASPYPQAAQYQPQVHPGAHSLDRFFPGLSISSSSASTSANLSQGHQNRYQAPYYYLPGGSPVPQTQYYSPAPILPQHYGQTPPVQAPPGVQPIGVMPQQNGGAMIMNMLGQSAVPGNKGNVEMNGGPSVSKTTLSKPQISGKKEAKNIGEAIANVEKKGRIGVENKTTEVSRNEFRAILQRMLTDKRLFGEIYEEYRKIGKRKSAM